MTVFECWEKGCKENNSLVYELNAHCNIPESGFYKVTSPYMVNGITFYRSPVYMVWWNGKQKLACMNYQEALSEWRKYESFVDEYFTSIQYATVVRV